MTEAEYPEAKERGLVRMPAVRPAVMAAHRVLRTRRGSRYASGGAPSAASISTISRTVFTAQLVGKQFKAWHLQHEVGVRGAVTHRCAERASSTEIR